MCVGTKIRPFGKLLLCIHLHTFLEAKLCDYTCLSKYVGLVSAFSQHFFRNKQNIHSLGKILLKNVCEHLKKKRRWAKEVCAFWAQKTQMAYTRVHERDHPPSCAASCVRERAAKRMSYTPPSPFLRVTVALPPPRHPQEGSQKEGNTHRHTRTHRQTVEENEQKNRLPSSCSPFDLWCARCVLLQESQPASQRHKKSSPGSQN